MNILIDYVETHAALPWPNEPNRVNVPAQPSDHVPTKAVAGTERREQIPAAREDHPLDRVTLSPLSENINKLTQAARASGDSMVIANTQAFVLAAYRLARSGDEVSAIAAVQNAARSAALDPSRYRQIYGSTAIADRGAPVDVSDDKASHDMVSAVAAVAAVAAIRFEDAMSDSRQFRRRKAFQKVRTDAAPH